MATARLPLGARVRVSFGSRIGVIVGYADSRDVLVAVERRLRSGYVVTGPHVMRESELKVLTEPAADE